MIIALSTDARQCNFSSESKNESKRLSDCCWRFSGENMSESVRPLAPMSALELHQKLTAGESFRLLDVREPAEFISELGHIDGSELIPLGTLSQNLPRFTGEKREI